MTAPDRAVLPASVTARLAREAIQVVTVLDEA